VHKIRHAVSNDSEDSGTTCAIVFRTCVGDASETLPSTLAAPHHQPRTYNPNIRRDARRVAVGRCQCQVTVVLSAGTVLAISVISVICPTEVLVRSSAVQRILSTYKTSLQPSKRWKLEAYGKLLVGFLELFADVVGCWDLAGVDQCVPLCSVALKHYRHAGCFNTFTQVRRNRVWEHGNHDIPRHG
jgi:hypothetical protein